MPLLATNKPGIIHRSMGLTKNEDGEIVITTPNYDRGNDRVDPMGAVLDNYLKNPVIMWLHDYRGVTPAAGIPVAKCPYLKSSEDGIISGPPDFLKDDPFAQRVKNAWDQDYIKTASIGFAPIDFEENELGGYDYKKWEMLEWSLVPIPMNAEAMRVAKSAGFEDLILPKRSQAEISDDLDYCLALMREFDLNEDNTKLALAIHDELVRRFPAGDTAVDILWRSLNEKLK